MDLGTPNTARANCGLDARLRDAMSRCRGRAACPEGPSFKSALRALIVESPLSHIAAPVHRDLTRAQLWGVRLREGVQPPVRVPGAVSSRITAIVKTFERPKQLLRLIESLFRLFPTVPVIVADDSRRPGRLPGVRTLPLPFDVGVSAGRQAALAEVRTEYTWVLDDDFVLYRGTQLARAIAALDAEPRIDILGGPVIDVPLCLKRGAGPSPIYPTRRAPLWPLGSQLAGLEVRDKVPNFFVARSERLRLVGWDPALKRLDHADFFTRARGVLTTVYDDQFRCLHAPTPFEHEYMLRRMDLAADAEVLRQRYFAGA